MKIVLSLFFVLLLFSCSDSTVYEKTYMLNDSGWDYKDKLEFKFNVKDSKQNYNLLINLKYKKTYPYSNLYFFVDIIDPLKKLKKDTIEYFMATSSGKWLGESSGEYINQQSAYRYNINFPEAGEYTIVLQHAMRDSLLKKISEVGMELQESQEN